MRANPHPDAAMPLDEIRYKTWVEVDPAAFRHNVRAFRALLKPRTGLWLVCKSNAMGHGLVPMASMGEKLGLDGFCVDSVVEGSRLRESGITKPILVLGPTLPHLLPSAAEHDLHLTVAGWDALGALARAGQRPAFHLKIDTGMHRQGFYPADLPKLWARIRKAPAGVPAGRRLYPLHGRQGSRRIPARPGPSSRNSERPWPS